MSSDHEGKIDINDPYITIVNMDKHGRIVIPVNIRRTVNTRSFVMEFRGDEIVLYPLKMNSKSIREFWGCIKVSGGQELSDIHNLKRVVIK